MKADHKVAKEDATYIQECRGNQQILNLAAAYLESQEELAALRLAATKDIDDLNTY